MTVINRLSTLSTVSTIQLSTAAPSGADDSGAGERETVSSNSSNEL